MPKTIFGTTEKSNFILNMKSATLQKLTMVMLALCVIIPQIGNLFAVAIRISGVDAASSLAGAFLYFTGFASILFFIIAMLKKEHTFTDNKIYFVAIFIGLWAFASYYSVIISKGAESDMVTTALFGELGRSEGLLAILAYIGIFLLATTVSKENTVKVIMDTMVGMGIVQAVIAVFQHIPGLNFLTEYADLPTLALKNVMLSSGLADSPIFFGSFLTIVAGIAFIGAIYDKNLIRARIYAAATVLFLLTGLFTSSIVAIIGIGCVLIAVTIIVVINRSRSVKFDNGLLKSSLARYGVLVGALVVTFVIVLLTQGIYIRDKGIAYFDCYYRLFITLSYSPVDKHSLYEIAWGRCIDFIKEYPIFGVGPDCFADMQFGSEELMINSIDRGYNEYLYMAATRGIPSLVAYLALIVYAIKRGIGGLKEFFGDTEKWYRPAIFAAVTAYLVQAFFSASTVTVAPLLWLLLGLLCAKKLGSDKK